MSEYDRERFQEQKVALAPGAKEQAYIQKFYLYLHLTKPSEYLYLTFSKISSEGKSLRPAYLIADLKRMYPELLVEEEEDRPFWEKELTPETALPYLVEGCRCEVRHLEEHGRSYILGIGSTLSGMYRWSNCLRQTI